jgi:hypothetical protein
MRRDNCRGRGWRRRPGPGGRRIGLMTGVSHEGVCTVAGRES